MNRSPHPFSLRQLQYAAAVAETRNFRQAAEACHVSQPSLSAQIAEMEDGLGVRLFERDRRRVLLTPAGEELVARARRILLEADDLVDAGRRARDPFTGTLRIGVIPTISPYLLPAIVPALRKRFPRLTLQWTEDKTEVLRDSLESGRLDGALLALEADVGTVERDVIARDPFVLATPRRHPLGQSDAPVAARELREAQFLLLDDGHCFRDQALSYCSSTHANELDFRATSLPTLAQMVASGAGVTLLPELAVLTEARRSELAVRRFSEPAPHRTIALVWRPRSPLGPALGQLASAIRDAYPVGPAGGRVVSRRRA
jgi:LysR family transcriptional regulator, hydrogen peroxide-inducible genes activator